MERINIPHISKMGYKYFNGEVPMFADLDVQTITRDSSKITKIMNTVQEKIYKLEREGYRARRVILGADEYEQLLADKYTYTQSTYCYEGSNAHIEKLFGLELIITLGSGIMVTGENREMQSLNYRMKSGKL